MFAGEGSEGVRWCSHAERYVASHVSRSTGPTPKLVCEHAARHAPKAVPKNPPGPDDMVMPNPLQRSIASRPSEPELDFAKLEEGFPGFRDAYGKTNPNDIQALRISETIKALVMKIEKPEPKYFYIEKSNPHDGFWHTADKQNVIFIPDGEARLCISDNGVPYVYKIPGATITCESWKGDLFIKYILLESGANAMQMYIPEDSPILKFIRVRQAVVSTLSPTTKPYPTKVGGALL